MALSSLGTGKFYLLSAVVSLLVCTPYVLLRPPAVSQRHSVYARARARLITRLREERWRLVGVHPNLVADLLGHNTVALTLNTYSHIIAGLSGETARVMDGVLASLRSRGQHDIAV